VKGKARRKKEEAKSKKKNVEASTKTPTKQITQKFTFNRREKLTILGNPGQVEVSNPRGLS